jgi:hypothetical protein
MEPVTVTELEQVTGGSIFAKVNFTALVATQNNVNIVGFAVFQANGISVSQS